MRDSLGCKDCCANTNSLTYLLTYLLTITAFKKLTTVADQVNGATSVDDQDALLTPTSLSPSEDVVVPTLRLCQLIRWPSYGGYGFNVVTDNRPLSHADAAGSSSSRRRYGHFIGKV